jgi:Ni/Co efflux regulator RcnB
VEEEGDTTGREEVRGRDWKRRRIREDGRDQHWHTIGRSWGSGQ